MKKFVWTILLALFSYTANAQIHVMHFNADWNSANDVKWFKQLDDVDKFTTICIAAKPDKQKKYEIVVVPTIIIFKDGEEVKRFQADISFAMKAKLEDVQEVINEQLMSDF